LRVAAAAAIGQQPLSRGHVRSLAAASRTHPMPSVALVAVRDEQGLWLRYASTIVFAADAPEPPQAGLVGAAPVPPATSRGVDRSRSARDQEVLPLTQDA
jgi:hypothetical protein